MLFRMAMMNQYALVAFCLKFILLMELGLKALPKHLAQE